MRGEFGGVEIIPRRERFDRVLRPWGSGLPDGEFADDRPAVGPAHRSQERLAAEHVPAGRSAARSHPEQHHPPRSVGCLHEVGVAGVLDRTVGAAVREDRIGGTGFERSARRWTARYRDAVAAFGAALGDHQVPVLADVVEVRGLGCLAAGRAGPDPSRFAEGLPGVRIDAQLRDSRHGAPAGAVVVPGEVGVDAGDVGQRDRIGPLAGRVGRGDQQVASAGTHVRGDQPESAVVMPQRRRVDAGRRRRAGGQRQLLGTVERVADLRPVHEIPAVEDRHAREVFKAGAREVVVLADAADTRVRMQPRDDGIVERLGHRRCSFGSGRCHCAPGPMPRRTTDSGQIRRAFR